MTRCPTSASSYLAEASIAPARRGRHGAPRGWTASRRDALASLRRRSGSRRPATRNGGSRASRRSPSRRVRAGHRGGAASARSATTGSHRLAWRYRAATSWCSSTADMPPTLSRCRRAAAGVRVESLARAGAEPGTDVEPHLARVAAARRHAVHGAEHRIPRRRRVRLCPRRRSSSRRRSTCCSSRSAEAAPAMSHPRVLVVAGGQQPGVDRRELRGAGRADRYFTNAVTEIVVGDNATRRSLQAAARERRRLPRRRDARACAKRCHAAFRSHSVSFGGALVRNDVVTSCSTAKAPTARLNGLYLVDGERLVDNHTTIDHAQAALREPRGLQGHPRRPGPRRLQRQDHRAPGRAEDRRQADEQGAAAVGRRADQHEAAARDLRQRREVHARRDRRPARRGGDLLPAGARPRPSGRRGTC